MSNLGQRIITALIGATLVISAILYSEFTFLMLLLVISILGVREFYHLLKQDHVQPQVLPGLLLTTFLFLPPLLSAGFGITMNLFPLLIIVPYLIFMRELYRKAEKPFNNIALTLLGPIYLAVPLFLFYLCSFHSLGNDQSYHPEIILGYLFILWSSDTGAYFSGKYLGRNKLFERISPKKTWEGFFGGMILSLIVAYVVSNAYTAFDLATWLTVAVIIVVTGVLGDLVESLFKRSIEIKDSGQLLPGHGGILDRFDSLYISAPFVFVYLLLFH